MTNSYSLSELKSKKIKYNSFDYRCLPLIIKPIVFIEKSTTKREEEIKKSYEKIKENIFLSMPNRSSLIDYDFFSQNSQKKVRVSKKIQSNSIRNVHLKCALLENEGKTMKKKLKNDFESRFLLEIHENSRKKDGNNKIHVKSNQKECGLYEKYRKDKESKGYDDYEKDYYINKIKEGFKIKIRKEIRGYEILGKRLYTNL